MKYSFIYVLLVCFILCIQPVNAFTAVSNEEPYTIIDGLIEDDLYVAGGNVIIEGTVMGDVVAAGGNVMVKGNITQDLIVAAGEVTIDGIVGDDVRAFSGAISIKGSVGDDVIVAGGDLDLADGSYIDGDLVMGVGQCILSGNVSGNVTGSAETLNIYGKINQNVDVTVADLYVDPNASILGELKYSSASESNIPETVNASNVTFLYQEKEEDEGYSVFWWVIKYLSIVVLGLLFLTIWPNRTIHVAEGIPKEPIKNLVIGLVLVFAAFIAAFVLFISLIGMPLSITLIFIAFFELYAARFLAGMWIGNVILRKFRKQSHPWMDLVLGVFILLLLTSIPVIGSLLYVTFTLIAIGNIYHEQRQYYTDLKKLNAL
jgi:cytoskeletal protein CcmA (bactofilin family)